MPAGPAWLCPRCGAPVRLGPSTQMGLFVFRLAGDAGRIRDAAAEWNNRPPPRTDTPSRRTATTPPQDSLEIKTMTSSLLAIALHATTAEGSIPACAGEPNERIIEQLTRGVYPRVCGGTRTYQGAQSKRKGLSPRVRGNHQGKYDHRLYVTSIPACAGEPPWSSPGISEMRVYPRVCGGTSAPPCPPRTGKGLSPRVRGNPSRGGRR